MSKRKKRNNEMYTVIELLYALFCVCVCGSILSACWGQRMLSGWDPPCCCRDTWCLSVGYGSLQPSGTFWAHLLWQMLHASAARQPGVSRWWCVSFLVGRKHFLLPLIVCEASDGCDSTCLHHGVARRTHIWSGGGMNLPEPLSAAKVEAGKHQT